MNETALFDKLTSLGVNQYGQIDVSAIPFKEEVRKMCEANSCGKYGTNWQCPPAVGEVSALRERVLSYPNAVLFNTVGALEDSFDFEGMMEAGAKHGEITGEINRFLRENNADFLLLGAGGCTKCKPCAYLSGKPCVKPEEAIASVEACGIFVVDLCRMSGFKYINGENTVTYFSLILYR